MSKQTEALKLALEALKQIDEAMPFPVAKFAQAAIREALAEQPAQQQEPVQTTPNFAQLKQILDNLDRCHHMDSKQEFLRTWIRDWTEHKLAKHIQPASKPWVGLTQQEQASVLASVPTVPFEGDWHLSLLTAIEAKLKEKNT